MAPLRKEGEAIEGAVFMPRLPEDRWYDDHAAIRAWLYEHPAYAHSGPPYTREKSRLWFAIHKLIEMFESDFSISPFYVQEYARDCLRNAHDPDVQAIYQAFIDEVEKQKRPIGYQIRGQETCYHLCHLPPDAPDAFVVYNFRYEIWLYACAHCGQLLIDEVGKPEEGEHDRDS
jgi:hypothetical protein